VRFFGSYCELAAQQSFRLLSEFLRSMFDSCALSPFGVCVVDIGLRQIEPGKSSDLHEVYIDAGCLMHGVKECTRRQAFVAVRA